MSIHSKCVSCSHSFDVPDSCTGKNINCPQCGAEVAVVLGFADDLESEITLDNLETDITIPDDLEINITIPDDLETDIKTSDDLEADITIPDDLEADITIPDDLVDNDVSQQNASKKFNKGISLEPIVTKKKSNPLLFISIVLIFLGCGFFFFLYDSEPKAITVDKIIDLADEGARAVIVLDLKSLYKNITKKEKQLVNNALNFLPKEVRKLSQKIDKIYLFFFDLNQYTLFATGNFHATKQKEKEKKHAGFNIKKMRIPKSHANVFSTMLQKDLFVFTNKSITKIIDRYVYSTVKKELLLDKNFIKSNANKIPFWFKFHIVPDFDDAKKIVDENKFQFELETLQKFSFEIGANKKKGYLFLRMEFGNSSSVKNFYDNLLQAKVKLKNYVAEFQTEKLKVLVDTLDNIEIFIDGNNIEINWEFREFIKERQWINEKGKLAFSEEIAWQSYKNKAFDDLKIEINDLTLFLEKYPEGIYFEDAENRIKKIRKNFFSSEVEEIYQSYLSRISENDHIQNYIIWTEFPQKEYKNFPIIEKIEKHLADEKEKIELILSRLQVKLLQVKKENSYDLLDEDFNKLYVRVFTKKNKRKFDKIFKKQKNMKILWKNIARDYKLANKNRKKYDVIKNTKREKELIKMETIVENFLENSYFEYISKRKYKTIEERITELKNSLHKLENFSWDKKLESAKEDLGGLKKLTKIVSKVIKKRKTKKIEITIATRSGKLRRGRIVKITKSKFYIKTFKTVEKIKYTEIQSSYLWDFLKKHRGNVDVAYSLGLLFYSEYTVKKSRILLRLTKKSLQLADRKGHEKAKNILNILE